MHSKFGADHLEIVYEAILIFDTVFIRISTQPQITAHLE